MAGSLGTKKSRSVSKSVGCGRIGSCLGGRGSWVQIPPPRPWGLIFSTILAAGFAGFPATCPASVECDSSLAHARKIYSRPPAYRAAGARQLMRQSRLHRPIKRAGAMRASEPRRELYPEIEPYTSGMLQVSPLHNVYFEQCGNPQGKPVVFLHGGPGAGCNVKCRRFFDPARYRIVLFDQRGCGRSTPHAELAGNTTWDLVADVERLREHLRIERWQVFGGSWGSTLALAYAQTHPARVTELVLRGIFMLRRWELEWFYQNGCDAIFPDAWEQFLVPIPPVERGDLISAY